jgi:large subunit ribosomal protein L25
VSTLDIGDNIKISDITLPDDAEPTITDRDFTIATIAGRVASAEPTDDEEVAPDEVESIEQDDETQSDED